RRRGWRGTSERRLRRNVYNSRWLRISIVIVIGSLLNGSGRRHGRVIQRAGMGLHDDLNGGHARGERSVESFIRKRYRTDKVHVWCIDERTVALHRQRAVVRAGDE